MAVTFTNSANWFQAADPTVTVSWAAGDEIIVFGATESGQTTIGTPTATGLTFSAITTAPGGGSSQESFAGLWRATAGSAGTSVTITGPRGGANGTQMAGIAAWVIGGGVTSVSALAGDNAESGYASVSAPSGGMVIVGLSDWNATNPPGKTPATGTGTATERVDTGNTSNYAIWVADWQGTTTTSATYGPNNYTSLKVAKVGAVITLPASAIELAAATTSGLTATATAASIPELASTTTSGLTTTASASAVPVLAATTASALTVTATGSSIAEFIGASASGLTVAISSATATAELASSSSAALSVAVTAGTDAELAGTTSSGLTVVATATAIPELASTTASGLTVSGTGSSTAELAGTSTSGLSVTATGSGASGPVAHLLDQLALSSADPHNITIHSATAGSDVYLVVNCAATVATPVDWTLVASRVATMGSYAFVLPGASNPGGDIAVSLDPSASRALAAVAFETPPLDTATNARYASLVASLNSPGSTAWGTTAHTFTTREVAVAVFCFHQSTGGPPAFDITSFDQGFSTLGDSGWAGPGTSGDEAARVILGWAESKGFTSDGVALTIDAAGPTASAVGFLAFDVITAGGAIELASDSPSGLTVSGSGASTAELATASSAGLTVSVSAGGAIELATASSSALTVSVTGAASIAELVGISTAGLSVTATGPASGSFALLDTFALASADPHNFTIIGATAGTDVWLVANTAAVSATPAGWTLENSRVSAMASYIYRLPGASNPGGDLAVTMDLSAGRPLAAVAFQAPIAIDGSVYASLVAPGDASGSTTWTTTNHTFSSKTTALALYLFHRPGSAGTPPVFNVSSFDNGFTIFADTGWVGTGTTADEGTRVIIGQRDAFGISAAGVTLTLTGSGGDGSAVGFLAFDYTAATVELGSTSSSALSMAATAASIAQLGATTTSGLTVSAVGGASVSITVDTATEQHDVADVTPFATAAELAKTTSSGLTVTATGSRINELAKTTTSGLTVTATGSASGSAVELAAATTSGLTVTATGARINELAATTTSGLIETATAAVTVELTSTTGSSLTLSTVAGQVIDITATTSSGLSVSATGASIAQLAASSSTAGVTLVATALLIAELAKASTSSLSLITITGPGWAVEIYNGSTLQGFTPKIEGLYPARVIVST